MHEGGDSEEQISEELSIHQVIVINTHAFSDHRGIILIYQQAADQRIEPILQCSILLIWRLLGALSTLYFVHGTQNLIGSIKYKRMGCFL